MAFASPALGIPVSRLMKVMASPILESSSFIRLLAQKNRRTDELFHVVGGYSFSHRRLLEIDTRKHTLRRSPAQAEKQSGTPDEEGLLRSAKR
jgi:hypothetical protein